MLLYTSKLSNLSPDNLLGEKIWQLPICPTINPLTVMFFISDDAYDNIEEGHQKLNIVITILAVIFM